MLLLSAEEVAALVCVTFALLLWGLFLWDEP
jgi:hypothetical protein